MQTLDDLLLWMPPSWLVRVAIAALWFYEGFWCKVLGRAPRQEQAVEAVPGMSSKLADLFFKALGYGEVVLVVWVLSNWAPGLCALAQTALLVFLTSSALIFARHIVHDPAGVVFKNVVFVTLIWVQPGLAALERGLGR